MSTTSTQLQNKYHLRTVAQPSSRPCLICYKPSTSVLITPDNKDFFYTCLGHLRDTGFASPVVDEAQMAAKRRREDLEREVESVKREWEEKNKNKNKDKDKTKDKDKDKDKKDVEPTLAAAGEKPVAPIVTVVGEGGGEGGTTSTTTVEADIPRIYTLHRNIFQMRVNRLRTAEMAKRNRERLGNPTNFFPSVPSGEL